MLRVFTKEKKEYEKSWSIYLNPDTMSVEAVDSETGKWICNLIIFQEYGEIISCSGAKDLICNEDYNPYEHEHKFNADDSIKIVN